MTATMLLLEHEPLLYYWKIETCATDVCMYNNMLYIRVNINRKQEENEI